MLSSRDGKEVFSFKTGMGDVNLVSLSCGETYVQVPSALLAHAINDVPHCMLSAADRGLSASLIAC